MTTKKITVDEIMENGVASLPTRPTAPTAFGGMGYTSIEMKEAFDRLPKLIIERLNLLLCDVEDGTILSDLPTGISSLPSLRDVIEGIDNERLCAAIMISGTSLRSFLLQLRADVDNLMGNASTLAEAEE